MLIPKHLQLISNVVKSCKTSEVAKIQCNCGCNRFIVYKYTEPLELHTKSNFNEIIRENDQLYMIKRNFWGKIVEKIECSDMFNEKPRNVVQVKCEKCNSEHIIYDNYKHGYDAVITTDTNATFFDSFTKLIQVNPQSLEVFVKIYQDISFNEFKEEFENLDFDTYLDLFSGIDIYGITSESKRIGIYSEETA